MQLQAHTFERNLMNLTTEYILYRQFRVHLLLVPSDCRERRGLAQRRMMRTLAPWVLENPIFFHMTNSSSSAVRSVLGQMKEVRYLP